MNFFKSILSDDPEPENFDNSDASEPNSPRTNPNSEQETDTIIDDDSNSNPNSSDGIGGWSFAGLVKTLTTQSESVLETYRRDLKEFGTGLKKETVLFREVASRAVKELPASSTSAMDGVLKSTAEIISHGKDALLAASDHDSDASETKSDVRTYSRFESQLVAIQSDVRTFCEEPEDLDDYSKWKSGFVLNDDKNEEIEKLIGDNGALDGMYKRVVPNEVDRDTFWFRYFYRVHKLKQHEDMRAKLVRRSLSVDDEEELSWDVDDDDDDDVEEAKEDLQGNVVENMDLGNKDLPQIEKKESSNSGSKIESSGTVVDEDKESSGSKIESSGTVVDEDKESNNNMVSVDKGENVSEKKVESVTKSDEKEVDNVESCKDSDVSVVSTQPSLQEEEDLGWDEIEDLGSHDEKKVTQGGSPNRADVKKRLSAAEEDEDLSWDIEDDDEPLKA